MPPANYDPVGASNGLFAPAYIAGNPQSEQAVAAWQAANHPLTADMIESLRMPPDYRPPSAATPALMMSRGAYGLPAASGGGTFGDPRGTVDPEALRVLAQGGQYDIEARRNAIAAKLMSNQAAQQQQAAQQAQQGVRSGLGAFDDYWIPPVGPGGGG